MPKSIQQTVYSFGVVCCVNYNIKMIIVQYLSQMRSVSLDQIAPF